jgi:3-methyladenine DNA glycosylase AlkC
MPTAEEMLDGAATNRLADCLERAGLGSVTVRRAAGLLGTQTFSERVTSVRDALLHDLPQNYPMFEAALRGLLDDAEFTGWMTVPAGRAVAERGLTEFEPALDLLAALTSRMTSEYAVRPFLLKDLPRAMAVLESWTTHSNEHVRRLASEGSRPRLPWAPQLPALIADPSPSLPVLDALYRDTSQYVRRSVANHLNDIGRDTPEVAVRTARRWLADPAPTTAWVARHGLRGLVKAGHPDALDALGFPADAEISVHGPILDAPAVTLGEALEFAATVVNTGNHPVRLAVDYVVHHVKANGSRTAKVFKLSELSLAPGERQELRRRHSFRPISTRRYYPGRHGVQIQVNGRRFRTAEFDLQP